MKKTKRKIGVFLALVTLIAIGIYMVKDSSIFESGIDKEEYVVPEMDINDPDHPDFDKIENRVHLRTGFVEGEGLKLVINNCTTCHSAKLVTQNRMSRERWLTTIRWMQETQNLWDLGANEEVIVNYLAKYYAPVKNGRRKNLDNIDWYELEGN
jgi:hypothetical protein